MRGSSEKQRVAIGRGNVFNSNTATTYEAIYDPTNAAAWFQPTAVVQPRFVRFNVQFDF